eukprot:14249239-Alexandrium_andersonii.AAC.1
MCQTSNSIAHAGAHALVHLDRPCGRRTSGVREPGRPTLGSRQGNSATPRKYANCRAPHGPLQPKR